MLLKNIEKKIKNEIGPPTIRVGRKILKKLTQFSPRSHPRHLVGQNTAQKDTIKDITSDSHG